MSSKLSINTTGPGRRRRQKKSYCRSLIALLWVIGFQDVQAATPGQGAFKVTYGIIQPAEPPTSCHVDDEHCRLKRSLPKELEKAHLDLDLITEEPLTGFSSGVNSRSESTGYIKLRLKRSPLLASPQFKYVINDGKRRRLFNETLGLPDCLYSGDVTEHGNLESNDVIGNVALSNCKYQKMSGIITAGQTRRLVIEELDEVEHAEHAHRVKRSFRSLALTSKSESAKLIQVSESKLDGGVCGLNEFNKDKMTAPKRAVVALNEHIKRKPILDSAVVFTDEKPKGRKKPSGDKDAVLFDDADPTPAPTPKTTTRGSWTNKHESTTTYFDEFPPTKPNEIQRKKRSTSAAEDKAIELAVYIDDEVFYNQLERNNNDDTETYHTIRELVFSYLNAVQLLYNSATLKTQIRILLVHLELFTTEPYDLSKSRNIDVYLDNFCAWQNISSDRNDDSILQPEHYDHGLLLTGLNLYDRIPSLDDVIGLAWVSGMCHPDYSCSICEGGNFESVFVMAHELGHNLGMNHDGDSSDGNNCDNDKFLMSPEIGPGKITWSTCSSDEILKFLSGSTTSTQSRCLDDLPPILEHYDYLKENQLAAGWQYTVQKQCQLALNDDFYPHVVVDSHPYENPCRELWCRNSSHALRVHPALEASDCSPEPEGYGSVCILGECVPLYDEDIIPMVYYGRLNRPEGSDTTTKKSTDDTKETTADNDQDGGSTNSNEQTTKAPNTPIVDDDFTFVAGRPDWYDPLYTKIFAQLKRKISAKYPSENGQTRVLPAAKEEYELAKLTKRLGPTWKPLDVKCERECGGGWTNKLNYQCIMRNGDPVEDDALCDAEDIPSQTRTPCNLDGCN